MADITVTAASVVPSSGAVFKDGTAGETITAGQTLYVDSTDSNHLKLCDADDSAKYVCVGIAAHGASDGQPIRYVVKDTALAIGATVAIGTIYITSGTAGGIAPSTDATAGDYVQVVGVGVSTSAITCNFQEGTRLEAGTAVT